MTLQDVTGVIGKLSKEKAVGIVCDPFREDQKRKEGSIVAQKSVLFLMR